MNQSASLPVADHWYEETDVGNGVSRILESHVAPWMRCNIWHVRGRDRDLLIDSGMGLRPLRAEMASLNTRPTACICTHCHFDHVGCAHEFETRLGHKNEAAILADPDLDRTCARTWLPAPLLTALPSEGYDLGSYTITPAPLTGYLDEGDVIDLGDRSFQVLHVPGHSPGSIALYEKASRTLFSGDLIYDGALIDSAWHSDPDAYRASLERLRHMPIDIIHAGHEGSFGRDRLHEIIAGYQSGEMRMGDVSEWLASLGGVS